MKRSPLVFLVLLTALVAGAVPVSADTLLTLKSHVGSFQVAGETRPAQDEEIRLWVGGDRIRRDAGETTAILRLDRNRLYVVRHPDRTYSELSLPVDFVLLMPRGSEEAGALWARQMKLSVRLEPAKETRTIGAWSARKVRMEITNATGMKIASTLWVSREVEGWSQLNRMAATLAALEPGSGEWVRELERMEGFPVLREDRVEAMGARFDSREELLRVETREADPALYEPPAGYTLVPFDPLDGLGG